MDNIILFDDPSLRGSLLPFTFTRPVADIRVGILKIKEKWELLLSAKTGYFTQNYLQEKFPMDVSLPALFINGALCPNEEILIAIRKLGGDDALWYEGTLLAMHVHSPGSFNMELAKERKPLKYEGDITLIQKNWHIFQNNSSEIRKDFERITEGRSSKGINDSHTAVYNERSVFVEEGVTIRAAILNAENGPIYLDKNSRVSEGAIIKGPFSLGEGSVVSMGAKIRGDTTIGPYSKVGGEVSNSVIFGYSNKGHDGYLGNSVVGEWCNFGADTNVSNMKNNYAVVKVWDYAKGRFLDSGLRFCGLMMGDHSKCGINTMWNTGTVVGVGTNIFGPGFVRNFVPSFSWGGSSGLKTYRFAQFEAAVMTAMKSKMVDFDTVDRKILQNIFDLTKAYRIWEKGF